MTAPIASGWSESPGGPRTHWKAPPCHGARRKQSFAGLCRLGPRHREAEPATYVCRSSSFASHAHLFAQDKAAAPPDPYRRASAHLLSACSFFGGFRTPALYQGRPLAVRSTARRVSVSPGAVSARAPSRETGRPPGPAADEVRVDRQSENRKGARPDDPTIDPRPRR